MPSRGTRRTIWKSCYLPGRRRELNVDASFVVKMKMFVYFDHIVHFSPELKRRKFYFLQPLSGSHSLKPFNHLCCSPLDIFNLVDVLLEMGVPNSRRILEMRSNELCKKCLEKFRGY